jgi:hypothetical protein
VKGILGEASKIAQEAKEKTPESMAEQVAFEAMVRPLEDALRAWHEKKVRRKNKRNSKGACIRFLFGVS